MNTVVTSRQALLAASRTVARRQGLGGLSIRAVAAEARVSVGSVYNYFSGKTELLAATVEEVWIKILARPEEAPGRLAAYVHWLFHRIQSGAGEYPGFFQGHAAGFLPEGRSAGRRTMAEALGRVRQTLLEALEADCAVRPSAFDASFSREQLAAFVLDSLLGQMSRGADNCEGLEQVLRRLLYRWDGRGNPRPVLHINEQCS